MKPLAIDLFCGMFGWSQGWLELGGEVVGFDLEHHAYHGAVPANASLVLQDVRTLHGSQFKDASLILASSPCQEFSYRAMPWKRAKALGPPYLGMELFAQAARIQQEAIAAAGHHIPMIQENVRGAQKWVGRSQWHFGSYYLWGDVPALMPVPHHAVKVPTIGDFNMDWSNYGKPGYKGKSFTDEAVRRRRPAVGNGARLTSRDCGIERYVQEIGANPDAGTKGYAARLGQSTISRRHGSKSSARKAASAAIARIPAPLARWIAQVYFPHPEPPTP